MEEDMEEIRMEERIIDNNKGENNIGEEGQLGKNERQIISIGRNDNDNKNKGGGCGLVIGSALVIGVIMAATFVFMRNKRRRDSSNDNQQCNLGLRCLLPSSWKDKQVSEDGGDSSMDLKSCKHSRVSWKQNQASEDRGDSSMEQDRDSSMEPNSVPILQPMVYEDKMPELEEASHPARSGEEHKHIRIEKKTHFNRETVLSNGATEESVTVDELPTNAWLRILSVLMLVLFLVWIFPFLVKLCMRFSCCPDSSLAVHEEI